MERAVPYAPAVTSELGRLAGECLLMTRARRLADWVGTGRPVTTKGVLRPADVPAVAAVLGVSVPAKVRSAADLDAIRRPWVAAQAVGWVRVSAGRVTADADADADAAGGDPVRDWWTAVRAVLRAESHDEPGRGGPVFCRTLLAVLGSPPAAGELTAAVQEKLEDLDPDDLSAAYMAWGRAGSRVEAGLELLAQAGAVDGRLRVTELGRWMAHRLNAEWPPPLSPDVSAAVLLDRLAGLADDDVWRQAEPWLIGREAGAGAAELLAAAAGAGPAQRTVAVDVVSALGEPTRSAWEWALGVPVLAPHARFVLAEFAAGEDDEPELDPADVRWLSVEYALAALTTEGLQEAYLVSQRHDASVSSGHPGEALLRAELAEFVAAGGPRIPAYEIKVSLVGLRPPVWRRLRLPATTTLEDLHEVIQVAFDWANGHPHVFAAGGRQFSDPRFGLADCADESRPRLARLLPEVGGTMVYLYDLGAAWQHRIDVERIIETDPPDLSVVCVGGKGDAPVEDSEGDTTPFDVAAVNQELAGLMRQR